MELLTSNFYSTEVWSYSLVLFSSSALNNEDIYGSVLSSELDVMTGINKKDGDFLLHSTLRAEVANIFSRITAR